MQLLFVHVGLLEIQRGVDGSWSFALPFGMINKSWFDSSWKFEYQYVTQGCVYVLDGITTLVALQFPLHGPIGILNDEMIPW